MGKKILLILPDEINNAILTKQLTDIGYPTEQIQRCSSLLASFSVPASDISFIFADLSHTQRGLSSALQELTKHFLHQPVIVLADDNDAETYLEVIRSGGQCLLLKGRLDQGETEKAIKVATERSNILQKARSTAMEYERHFDNGPIPMWIIDETTMRFLMVNNAAVEKYGYSKEEFSRMSILDVRPPEDIEATLEKYYARNTNYYDAGYWRHMKKNGEVFYVHVYSHTTQFGNAEARLAFVVDVDSKLKADERNRELNTLIKEQKERLDSILSTISDAIWSRRADTNELLYGNRAYRQLYGYTDDIPDQYKQLSIESVHPADRPNFYRAMEEVKVKGTADLIYRFTTKDGSLKTLKVSAAYKKGVNGKMDTIDGVTIDITKEKELYDTIRNSEQKLLATINNTKDLIWSVDKDLKIIFCNSAYQEFCLKYFGVALDEGDYILGNWLSDSFIGKRIREYERALNGESFITLAEERIGGETKYMEISSSPIYDVDGRVAGVNCVSRDITVQEMQLIHIKRQNKKLKEIAWMQSHKVRGPVANILGLLSLMEDDQGLGEYNRDIVEKLRYAAESLDTIIRDIVSKTDDIEEEDALLSKISQQ